MIKLKVNGKNQQFDSDLNMPLFWLCTIRLNR
jgi:hypothetical protein